MQLSALSPLLALFLVIGGGYLLGLPRIGGLRLGSSGILFVALLAGHFGMELPAFPRELGLVLFIAAIGFMAGPQFFSSFRGQAASYILIGVLTVLVGAGLTAGLARLTGIPAELAVGVFTGAMTSTPGLAAALEATGSELASVGYGIAYPCGVLAMVLFVQLTPRLLGKKIENASAPSADAADIAASAGQRRPAAYSGLLSFALAAAGGILLGSVHIPLPAGLSFSLGNTGGVMLAALLLAHFGHLGRCSLRPQTQLNDALRELGLALFLAGAGVDAGNGALAVLRQYGWALFGMGAAITVLSMLASFALAYRLRRLPLLDSLSAVCGGMTSTPALGCLLSQYGGGAAAAAYAATYPFALAAVVLGSQLLALLL
ncbi:MAG: permease [Bacillota bacterium]|nr:permease [Bacillota bacterium]